MMSSGFGRRYAFLLRFCFFSFVVFFLWMQVWQEHADWHEWIGAAWWPYAELCEWRCGQDFWEDRGRSWEEWVERDGIGVEGGSKV